MTKSKKLPPQHPASSSAGINKSGQELASPISRTVAAYLPTMGERIRRYTRTSELQSQSHNNPDLWDDEDHEALFDEDGSPVSVHETRYQEGLIAAKKLKSERDKTTKEEKLAAEKTEKEAFQIRVNQAVRDGSLNPPIPELSPKPSPKTVDKPKK